MKKHALLLLSFLILFSVSCKQEEPLSTKEILTKTDWRLNSLTFNPAQEHPDTGKPETEFFDYFYDECTHDNFWTFHSDNTYQIDGGEEKCDENDPDLLEVGTWQFGATNERLVLQVNFSSQTEKFTITKITENEFHLAGEEMLNGETVIVTFGFEAVE